MSAKGTVYVVDDDETICALVESTLTGAGLKVRTFPSVEAFVAASPKIESDQLPCCLLMDLVMPGQGGLEFLEMRGNKDFPCPVIMMTARGTVNTAVKSMKLGAADFLEKPFAPADLIHAVIETLNRCTSICAILARTQAVRAKLVRLSPRERELLEAIVAGSSTKMIADRLGISARTVDHHRANLMEKMQANNVADLVRMAVEANYKEFGTIPPHSV